MKSSKAIAMALALLCAGAAYADDFVLNGNYIKLGVNNSGSLIDFTSNTGLQFAGADFIIPGAPFAFYSIGAGSSFDVAGAGSSNNPFGVVTKDVSGILGFPFAVSSKGNAYGLDFIQNIYFGLDDKTIHVDVTLKNKSGHAIDDVKYAVGLDPDQGISTGHGFDTFNSIGAGPLANVTATAPNGLSIKLHDIGGGKPSFASVSGAWETNPTTLLTGLNDGNGDNTIALAYNVGKIANGDQVTLSYGYTVAAVPEPETYTMLVAGLGLLGGIARRRKTTS